MRISKHAAQRLFERTKLKKTEFQTILDTFAFVELDVIRSTYFILFYDARGDEFFVAVIREECVVSIICIWQRLPVEIKKLANVKKIKNRAESYFYNRASRILHPTLQSGLNVYVSFESKLNKVIVPEEFIIRVDRFGYEICTPNTIMDCFAEDISRILVREMSSANAHWIVCVTLRRLHGQIVKKYSCRIGKILNTLPLHGALHDALLYVHFGAEEAKFELGSIAAECSVTPMQIIANFHEQFLQVYRTVAKNYSLSEQLKFKYSIELRNNMLSWTRMFPVLSNFELREYISPFHPS